MVRPRLAAFRAFISPTEIIPIPVERHASRSLFFVVASRAGPVVRIPQDVIHFPLVLSLHLLMPASRDLRLGMKNRFLAEVRIPRMASPSGRLASSKCIPWWPFKEQIAGWDE